MMLNPPSHPIRVRAIDSHTCGEPTRVLLEDVARPEGATMAEKRNYFSRELDWLRTASVCEPRGHDAMVGALLCEPVSPDCVTGVIFFNNVGCLNGCLHATMGVAVTLIHLGRIQPGTHKIDTPTGIVTVDVDKYNAVKVTNIRSYRYKKEVQADVPGLGIVTGDIAWGGNWFFLSEAPEHLALDFKNIERLTDYTWAIRQALESQGITGEGGAEVDHIEIFGAPADADKADCKNFVLCPGKAYDRSPCGTGTSAKLACLHADGKLNPGGTWRQASILDTVFTGTIEPAEQGGVYPTITGSAHITSELDLIINPTAQFPFGITN